ncbi:MAG: hypothetical protein QOJ59_4042 [Thermomicrobiales bacterium]|nr:hypothetical protein [Thermomicrobiales bacterium]
MASTVARQIRPGAESPPRDVPQERQASEMPEWASELLHAAQRRAVSASPAAMAGHLQSLFGQRITAMITGVDDPKTVGRWARGQAPQERHFRRLQDAFQVVSLLEIAESEQVARAWFLGMNPDLGDQSPAAVLADDPAAGGQRIMRAARSYLARG